MSDMSDLYGAMKQVRAEKRASNRESSALMLQAAGISFVSNNDGAHLIVTALGRMIDFWPGTGLWIVRGDSRRQRGVKRLIYACTPEGVDEQGGR